MGAYFGSILSTYGALIAQVVLMLLFACLYWQKVVQPIVEGEGTLEMHKEKFRKQEDDFAVNICQCFDDMWVCLHGWCCPLARMSHTNAVAGILGYWETALVWCCCATFIPLGPCCLTVWFRMKLKEIMNVKDNIFNDIVIACCCPCLSICQQGTAVDRAMGYEVVGCCDLEWNDGKLRDMDAYDA
jgi:Cys-rich protein (TIGR01571 family)